MKKISMFVFAAVVAGGSFTYAAPRDAGSKIRGEAQSGSSDSAARSRSYARPAPQQQYVRTAPQAPANATAQADGQTKGTRTMSVEPQTAPARTQTYRTYAPQRRGILGWIFGN